MLNWAGFGNEMLLKCVCLGAEMGAEPDVGMGTEMGYCVWILKWGLKYVLKWAEMGMFR